MESSKGANIMEISSFVPVTFQEGRKRNWPWLEKTEHCCARDGRSLRETMGPVLLQMLCFLKWYCIIVMNRGPFFVNHGPKRSKYLFLCFRRLPVSFSVACWLMSPVTARDTWSVVTTDRGQRHKILSDKSAIFSKCQKKRKPWNFFIWGARGEQNSL